MSGHLPSAVSPIIRVLLIDDNVDKLKITKAFMERADPTLIVDTEASPRRAIASVKGKHYDVIVTDYHMPEMDGLTLTRRVRETEKVPIILYTGMGSEEVAEAAFKAGVNDYVMLEASPAHYQVLVNRVRHLVERHRVEEVYRAVVEGSMDAFSITVGNTIVYVNQAMAQLVGVKSPEDLEGKELKEWVPNLDDEHLKWADYVRQKGERKPEVFETKIRRVDGETRLVEASLSVTNYYGRTAVLAFVRDVTEKRAMEEAQRRERERLESLRRHSVKLNSAVTVEEVADIALSIMDEVMDVELSSFMVEEDGELITLQVRGSTMSPIHLPLNGPGITVQSFNEKRTVVVEDTRLEPAFVKGSTDSLSELATPIMVNGEVVGVFNMESLGIDHFNESHMVLAEILAQHVASALDRLRKEEERIQATVEAEESRVRAQQSEEMEKMKTRFISTATHELRTPLTSIKGYLELIRSRMERLSEAEGFKEIGQMLVVVSRNADRLEELINDLLDVQRLTEGRIQLVPARYMMDEFLQQVNEELAPTLERRNQSLHITSSVDSLVFGKLRFIQVLQNLLLNASKFGPEGSTIRLSVEKLNGYARFSVRDEGIGLAPEDIPRLFSPFPSIDKPGLYEGTGLGLSICKGIVELHGGEIWAESPGPGKGSTFAFTIPYKADVST